VTGGTERLAVALDCRFDVSRNGTLAYVPSARSIEAGTELAFVGQDGTAEPHRLPRGRGPRFSPDGRQLVYWRTGRHGRDILIYDLDCGTERHITDDEGEDLWPIFSRDGRSAVFNSECIARVGRE